MSGYSGSGVAKVEFVDRDLELVDELYMSGNAWEWGTQLAQYLMHEYRMSFPQAASMASNWVRNQMKADTPVKIMIVDNHNPQDPP